MLALNSFLSLRRGFGGLLVRDSFIIQAHVSWDRVLAVELGYLLDGLHLSRFSSRCHIFFLIEVGLLIDFLRSFLSFINVPLLLRLSDVHLLIFIKPFESCFKVLYPVLLTRTLRPLIIVLNSMLLIISLILTLRRLGAF